MSEPKFTKGVWIPSKFGFQVLGDNCKVSVCELSFPTPQMEEQIANSRLISAAPDLLEACELALLRTKLLLDGLGIKLPEETPNLIDTLEKAITKARK